MLGKPFSDKSDDTARDHLNLAGLTFTEKGVRLDDEAVQSLRQCLVEAVSHVRTATHILHIVGVIQYCSSAPGVLIIPPIFKY